MLFALAATIFWFFYLVVCPSITLGVTAAAAFASRSLLSAVALSLLALPLLVLLLGPAFTEVGPMSWWLPYTDSHIVSRSGIKYFIWPYAFVCAALQAAFLVARLFFRLRA